MERNSPQSPGQSSWCHLLCFYGFEQLSLVTKGMPSIHHHPGDGGRVLMGGDLPQWPLQLPLSFPEILFAFSFLPLSFSFLACFLLPVWLNSLLTFGTSCPEV